MTTFFWSINSSHKLVKVMLGSNCVVIGVTKDSKSSPRPPSVMRIISDSFNYSLVIARTSFKIATLIMYSSIDRLPFLIVWNWNLSCNCYVCIPKEYISCKQFHTLVDVRKEATWGKIEGEIPMSNQLRISWSCWITAGDERLTIPPTYSINWNPRSIVKNCTFHEL